MNALLPDILEIEALDFTPAIPCEHSQHPEAVYGHTGSAYYLIRPGINPCGHDDYYPDHFYICKGGYDDNSPIECGTCHAKFPKEAVWTIVAKVGS